MSTRTRNLPAPAPVRCAVLTVSDSRTIETDTSGHALVALLEGAGHLVTERQLVRDDPQAVATAVRQWANASNVDVIVTTGGTGIARRDTTYDALRALIERELPGFGETFRRLSFDEIGTSAMLTRATAGVTNQRAIFILPGAEHAVRLALTRLILPELGHLVRELARP
jgi:molybdenum cofactor biosynthesis protein B